jgi:hypothetical protein
MRIKNRYNRDKHFRNKHWKRVRNQEHPFQTHLFLSSYYARTHEEQVLRNFKYIHDRAMAMESGRRGYPTVAADFRRMLNRQLRTQQKQSLHKVNAGDYEDVIFPLSKKTAAWLFW